MIGRILVGLSLLFLVDAQEWKVKLNTSDIKIPIDSIQEVMFSISLPKIVYTEWKLMAKSSIQNLVLVDVPKFKDNITTTTTWNGKIKITGLNLGKTNVILYVFIDEETTISSEGVSVTIIRRERIIDKIFVVSVAILVSILYVNFGCAMDWKAICEVMREPIGPLIGLVCQLIMMPLLAFSIGHLLFPNNPELQLGIFFTGISPSGGASNIWTVLLEGNLNLSIAMTTLSTLAAFVTIPLWVFTVGKYVFDKNDTRVPYRNIGIMALSLIIPLVIGYFIQKKYPKLCIFMVRIIKTFSAMLILFIVIFAVVTNFYLFKLFSWRIVMAGISLPWLGFSLGLISMSIFKQSLPDIKAIAIETGIQNTGIAIFLLKFSMDQPEADLTTVIPVSVAIMTPLPLLLAWFIKTIFGNKKKKINESSESLRSDSLPVATPIIVNDYMITQ